MPHRSPSLSLSLLPFEHVLARPVVSRGNKDDITTFGRTEVKSRVMLNFSAIQAK